MLLDSPLNKAGLLQVYIQTKKGVLIEVLPSSTIYRSQSRLIRKLEFQERLNASLLSWVALHGVVSPFLILFSVQLLQKFSIRATNGPEKLLKVIKNPVTDHLPADCRKIRLTETAKKCQDVGDFVTTLPPGTRANIFECQFLV